MAKLQLRVYLCIIIKAISSSRVTCSL